MLLNVKVQNEPRFINFQMLFDEVQTQRAQQLVENEKSKIFINLYKSVQSLQWESQNY
jgi:hypothetical protein